ncbi:MAG TPA: SpoIID/LytB domain-containing protein [Longimicrobiales bacterium]|nr:SpoIID/LytB domain-containing protein [Longimicrobiales bacterium]
MRRPRRSLRSAGRGAAGAARLRLGLLAFLSLGALPACTVAGPRPGAPEPPGGPGVEPGDVTGAEPSVRVGVVVNVESLRVDGTGGLELVDEGGRVRARSDAGESWTMRRSDGGVAANRSGETVRVPGSLVVRPRSGEVMVDGSRYRGSVLIRPGESGVTAVNTLDLETYLLGVVPHEIGSGRPPEDLEAVKAQAVAARTYAIRNMGRRSDLGFDVYATVSDQVYGGADSEDAAATRAVRETHGQILTYQGEPIEAYYHSTCGGQTAALHEVWDSEPRPYLRSVSDEKPGGGWYCESSNRFRWTEEWTGDELVRLVEQGLEEHTGRQLDLNRIEEIGVDSRTTSGRVASLSIRTDAGTFDVPGDRVRWVLRPEQGRILNSAAIALHPSGNDGVEHLAVEGAGWGHGIGMCQVGAMGRSRAGQSYQEILQAYYPGTSLSQLYR